MMKKYLLGADMGSGGCKVTVIDEEGNLVAEGAREYPTYYPYSGWAENLASDLLEAFCEAVRGTLEKARISPRQIQALCTVGVTHNTVLLGAADNVLRPIITMFDERSWEETQRIKRDFGKRILEICGNEVTPLWTLPQLVWLRNHEPETYRSIRKYMFPKDYVRYMITGTYVTDWIDAMGTLFYDPFNRCWSREICEYLGIDPETLPEAVSPRQVVARVNSQGAQLTGIAEGTPVVCGSSDTAAEVFASGAIRTGQCTVKLATVGRICVVADAPAPDPKLLTYRHLVEGKWYVGTGTKACASSVRWARDTFCEAEKRAAAEIGVNAYEIMDLQAAKAPAGSLGLIFHPYLLGEQAPYYDPSLRGHFLGISFRHSKAHFLRSVYEGTAFSLRDSLDLIRSVGVTIGEIRLIGGGTKSRLWSQIIADVLNEELNVPRIADASLGAALLAGIGVGAFKDEAEAIDRAVRIDRTLLPQPESRRIYDRLFEAYRRSYLALREIDKELCRFG